MRTIIKNARIILPDTIIDGYVIIENGTIQRVAEGMPGVVNAQNQVIDLGGKYLSPGWIDSHIHGGGHGGFSSYEPDSIVTAAKTHMRHGVTTIFPSVVPASTEQVLRIIDTFRAARFSMEGGPHMPGLHIEGPYLNVRQRGAIREQDIRPPCPQEYEAITEYAAGDIKRWTLAPEIEGAMAFASYLCDRSILPSIGHSEAEYAQMLEAFRIGCTHITHLYSATSFIVRRGGFRFPGVTESAFAIEDMTVELIADGCHLPPELLRMVWRLKGVDRVCLVTDAGSYAGTDEAASAEPRFITDASGRELLIEDGVMKMADRSVFAGSISTADRLIRIMQGRAGIPLVDCVRMMSLTPAKILGIDRSKGSLAARKDADMIVFDENIDVSGVMVGGQGVYGCLM